MTAAKGENGHAGVSLRSIHPPERLPSFDSESGLLNVVIETPKHCRNKYSFDPESGLFQLKKVLPLGASFPFDFGFIPSTKAEDGDPLDVLVLMDEPAFCGCLVLCRLLGVIEARQQVAGKQFERNDRLIAQAAPEQKNRAVSSLTTLNADLLDQIEQFFISYNAQAGKKFQVLRRQGPVSAKKLVMRQQAGSGERK